MFSAPKLKLTPAQLALALRLFVDTNQSLDASAKLDTIYGITRSSYAPERHYILLGTDSNALQWISVHPTDGPSVGPRDLCEGWQKPELPDPRFVTELGKYFTLRLMNADAKRRECKHRK